MSLGCGITKHEYAKYGSGVAGGAKKMANQLTSTQAPHLKALEELRVITNLAASGKLPDGGAGGQRGSGENRDSGAYGGPAKNPRNKIFEGCLVTNQFCAQYFGF